MTKSKPSPQDALATQIRARRKALSLTQEEAAELAGCSSRFVREVERGKATVRLDKLRVLFRALGLELTVRLRSVP